MPVPFPPAGHWAHTPGGSAAAPRPVTGVRLCFCGLQTLTHKARGFHIAYGVTIADRIRFREFVVLTSVFVPKAASQKPLRGPQAALGAASADKDTCNELCESLPGCQRGPVPHTRFGFPPATPGGSGARPLPRRHGAPFRGRGPEAGGDRRPFTVKSCPPAAPFPSTTGEASWAPGPRAAPSGGAVMCSQLWCCLPPTPPRPAVVPV